MKWILILCISSIGAWLGLRLSRKLKILDRPDLYADVAKTRGPVPTLQGVILFVLLSLLLVLFFPHLVASPLVIRFLAGAGILVIVGSMDDVFFGRHIPASIRLLTQFIISFAIVYTTGVSIDSFSLGNFHVTFGPIIGTLGSVVWCMLCMNAVNFFDGINGQASGVSTIGFATIAGLITFVVFPMYSDMSPETTSILEIVRILAILFAILAAVYSIVERKPYGLLRDAGTLVFGFALAYLSLLGGVKIGTVLVVLSLVIFDAIRVCLHRIFVLKKNPFKGDYTHLHHRLLRLGRNKKEIVITSRMRSIGMMILMLIQGENKLNKLIIFALMALLFFGINAYLFRIKKLPCGLEKPIRPEEKK